MNTNDDRNESDSELDVHAMLTALVLGELEPDAAARWNDRCANEPDLMAQKERIEATIGLLKAALPGDAALSAETLATLGQAAAAGPTRRAFSFPWRFAIAAGTVIGAGLGFAYFAHDEDAVRTESQQVALATAPQDAAVPATVETRDLNSVASDHSEIGAVDVPIAPGVPERASIPDLVESQVPETAAEPKVEPTADPASSILMLTGTTKDDAGAVTTVPFVPAPSEGKPAKQYRGPGDSAVPTEGPGPQASPLLGGSASGHVGAGVSSASRLNPGGGLGRARFQRIKAGEPPRGPATGGGRGPESPGGGPPVPVAKNRGDAGDHSTTDEELSRLNQLGYTGGTSVSTGGAKSDKSLEQKINEKLKERREARDAKLDDSSAVAVEFLEAIDNDNFEPAGGFVINGFADLPAAERARIVVDSCRPRPRELPRDMFFRWYGDNAFQRSALDRLSTFSIDVDTASYPLVRNYLERGEIPPKDAVRTEEFVNYFKADLGAPQDGSPFAVWLEAAPSPYGGSDRARWLLRVGVRAKDVAKEQRQPLRLAFVVDTSGSMATESRLELVKYGLRLLAGQLDPRDKIAIVKFSTDADVVLQWTNASERATIEAAIHGLHPEGSTNAEAGLKLGYQLAVQGLEPEAVNRVVILSDGVANTGQTDQDRICADVKSQRQRGIYLNAIGVGMGNHNDTFLERLADQGDGVCSYIDDEAEAKRSLVDRFIQQTMTIARDVKIQLEFDPAQVERWRQLGYENRAIADADFRNDAVDAGEVGAGHQIVALYEIEPMQRACTKCAGRGYIEFYNTNPSKPDSPDERVACADCNHTGHVIALDGEALAKQFATIRIRYKEPYVAGANAQNETAKEIVATIPANAVRSTFEETSLGFQKSALVAQFAEFLRRSIHARGDSLDNLVEKCVALSFLTQDPEFAEFTKLVDKSRSLIMQNLPRTDELTQAVDALRRNQLLQTELNALAQNQATDVLKQLEEQNRKLEDEIRRLIEQRMK